MERVWGDDDGEVGWGLEQSVQRIKGGAPEALSDGLQAFQVDVVDADDLGIDSFEARKWLGKMWAAAPMTSTRGPLMSAYPRWWDSVSERGWGSRRRKQAERSKLGDQRWATTHAPLRSSLGRSLCPGM